MGPDKKQQKYGEKYRLVEKNQDLGDLGKVLKVLKSNGCGKPMETNVMFTWHDLGMVLQKPQK